MHKKRKNRINKSLRVAAHIRRRKWLRVLGRKGKKYLPLRQERTFLQDMYVTVGYHDIYRTKEVPESVIKNLLADIPVAGALCVVNNLHKQVMYMTTNKTRQVEMTKLVLSYLDSNARSNYYMLKKQASKRRNQGVLLTNNISELLLSYYIILYGDKLTKQLKLQEREYANLFKALLCCNDICTDYLTKTDDCGTIIKKYGIEGLEVKIDLPISEYKRDKQIVEPIYKAFALFKYCDMDAFWQPRITQLCLQSHAKTWSEYLAIIVNIISSYIANEQNTSIDLATSLAVLDFMDAHSHNGTIPALNSEQGPLFSALESLRGNFYWKLQKNEYIPLNHNLLIDLIYQSIKFDLLKIVQREKAELIDKYRANGYPLAEIELQDDKHILGYIRQQGVSLLDEEKKIIERSSFLGLNGEFGQNFSQQYLLEPLMSLAFDKDAILLKEDDMRKYDKAPSDYYVRVGNVLYLFELKDTYLNDDIKYSKDIHTVLYGFETGSKHVEGIADKLCKDGSSNRKGVPQLMNSIVQIVNNKKLDPIDEKASSVRHIFPILVTTDTAFSANGVNAFIVKKYREDVRKNYPLNNEQVNVHLPAIINLDFFIRYSEMLYTHKISLANTLNRYFGSKAYKLTSFDAFVFDRYKHHYNTKDCIEHLQLNGKILRNII